MSSEIRYVDAIRLGLADELEADERVILMGEEIGKLGGVFTVTSGLQERFGSERVMDSLISEAALVGWAIGAASEGLRPVVEIMFMDFAMLALDQIVNLGAKLRYMSGGQFSVPLLIRMPGGGGTHHGPQHSQSLETWFAHTPGLVVGMPATASDAYWMTREGIRCEDPVIIVESKYLYFRESGIVEDNSYPRFKARISRDGDDITVATAGRMVPMCEKAASKLELEGISCEVVDLRYLWPLDKETIAESVRRTNRLIVVHEAVSFMGWGAEIAGWAADSLLFDLDGPVRRLGAARYPIPFNSALEDRIIPTIEDIVSGIRELAHF